MKHASLFFTCLMLAACGKPTSDQVTDTSSEAAIAHKADEITAAADAEVNKAIAEIETASPRDDAESAAAKTR